MNDIGKLSADRKSIEENENMAKGEPFKGFGLHPYTGTPVKPVANVLPAIILPSAASVSIPLNESTPLVVEKREDGREQPLDPGAYIKLSKRMDTDIPLPELASLMKELVDAGYAASGYAFDLEDNSVKLTLPDDDPEAAQKALTMVLNYDEDAVVRVVGKRDKKTERVKESILDTSWAGSKANFVSKPGVYGEVPHSELAMHTGHAGHKITQYAYFLTDDSERHGVLNWGHVQTDKGVLDGLPHEVFSPEILKLLKAKGIKEAEGDDVPADEPADEVPVPRRSDSERRPPTDRNVQHVNTTKGAGVKIHGPMGECSEKGIIGWSKNLASNYRDGGSEAKSQLIDAIEELGLDSESVHRRFDTAQDADLRKEQGWYFILTGKAHPKDGYAWESEVDEMTTTSSVATMPMPLGMVNPRIAKMMGGRPLKKKIGEAAEGDDPVDIYQLMKDAGVEMDHHSSDLYVRVTPESKAIINKYEFKSNVSTFRSQIDKSLWYNIPFAYRPFWDEKQKLSAKYTHTPAIHGESGKLGEELRNETAILDKLIARKSLKEAGDSVKADLASEFTDFMAGQIREGWDDSDYKDMLMYGRKGYNEYTMDELVAEVRDSILGYDEGGVDWDKATPRELLQGLKKINTER